MKMPKWPIPIGYRNIELGLDRINQLLDRLGNPQDNLPPVIHVAGTNGKGSTIAFMRAVLEAAGYKVHVYTSPHLVEFNERYVVAGQIVSDYMLNDALEECKQAAGDDMQVTFFEGTTAAAFVLFSQIDADIVLLETGLGGRLDATNVVKNPALTVITPIAKDHMDFLGEELEDIAQEKARIMKFGADCFSASQKPIVEAVLRNVAEEVGCSLRFINQDNSLNDIALYGQHQRINASLAVAAIKSLSGFEISDSHIQQGLANTHWDGRMQKLLSGDLVNLLGENDELWLDGGHNEAAGCVIVDVAKSWNDNKPLYIICAMLQGKDSYSFLEKISPVVEKLYAVAIADEQSSMQASELMEESVAAGIQSFTSPNISNAIRDIIAQENRDVRILICGSLYLAGTVLASNS